MQFEPESLLQLKKGYNSALRWSVNVEGSVFYMLLHYFYNYFLVVVTIIMRIIIVFIILLY